MIYTLFSLRLSYSGKAVHRISASAGQEAFFEGHVHAFNGLGGVPTGKIRYDNLKAAVASVVGFSRQRVETDRWTAFRSHYGIDAFYCQPGIQARTRKAAWKAMSAGFAATTSSRSRRSTRSLSSTRLSRSGISATSGAGSAAAPTPSASTSRPSSRCCNRFPTTRSRPAGGSHHRVDRYAQITVRMNTYSVPAKFLGRQLRVLLHASELAVYDGRAEVARHERLMTKGATRVDLDHYLEVLLRKPGALAGATALEQARAAGRFTPTHDAWWAAARKAHGDTQGTRALIEVLLLHRYLPHAQVVAGIAAALDAGALPPPTRSRWKLASSPIDRSPAAIPRRPRRPRTGRQRRPRP